jgi:toxin-antitoxin system PIN domain toxin
VNVWVALTYGGHVHHGFAKLWFHQLESESRICFCRFTQLSLLRLLTTEAVMGADEVRTQKEAWEAYDHWLSDGRVVFLEESPNLDSAFRSFSDRNYPGPKTWSDAYLAAFAAAADLQLVTFDQGFRGRVPHLLILRP